VTWQLTLAYCLPSAAGITLQSGLVVDLNQLQQQYQGQCCLPRSVLNDNSALLRIDNSNGRFFVSMDPSCATPLASDVYPVMFEYISVGCTASSSSSSSTYVINGGALGVCHDCTAYSQARPAYSQAWHGMAWH
jgi:hypothetical protein